MQLRQQIAGSPVGPFVSTLLDVRQDLRGQLVPVFGSAPLRQQTTQPGRFECGMGLIGGWQRDAEQPRRHRYRHGVDAVPADHLVAQLQQIARVEETAAAEWRVDHGGGVTIEGAGRREGSEFAIRYGR